MDYGTQDAAMWQYTKILTNEELLVDNRPTPVLNVCQICQSPGQFWIKVTPRPSFIRVVHCDVLNEEALRGPEKGELKFLGIFRAK